MKIVVAERMEEEAPDYGVGAPTIDAAAEPTAPVNAGEGAS